MLSREQAIKECKELWEEIWASGMGKEKFFESKLGVKWVYKNYYQECPLCDYTVDRPTIEGAHQCLLCPLMQTYGATCDNLGYEYETTLSKWMEKVRGLK